MVDELCCGVEDGAALGDDGSDGWYSCKVLVYLGESVELWCSWVVWFQG